MKVQYIKYKSVKCDVTIYVKHKNMKYNVTYHKTCIKPMVCLGLGQVYKMQDIT